MWDRLKSMFGFRAQQSVHVSSPAMASLFAVSSNSAGVHVNKTSALNCMAYWSGIRLLSESMGLMPIRLYRAQGKTTPVEVTEHDSLGPVRSPNPTQTPFNFVQTGMAHVLTRGNVYAEIATNGAGNPAELWLMDPDDIEPQWASDQRHLEYVSKSRRGKTFPQDQVIHVPGLGFDGVRGYDIVTVAQKAIGLAMGAEQYGAGWFGSGGRPMGTLENAKALSEQALERQRADWNRIHAPGSHAIAILQDGTTFKPFDHDPAKAQALEVRKFQIAEIARLLRIPPHMLYDLDRATFSNIEQMSLDFLIYSLAPWMCAWEQELTRKLLSEADRRNGLFFRFDTSALLRGDPHNSASSHSLLVNAGIEAPNEARAVFDLPPMDGAETLRVPLNSAALGSQPMDPAATRSEERGGPGSGPRPGGGRAKADKETQDKRDAEDKRTALDRAAEDAQIEHEKNQLAGARRAEDKATEDHRDKRFAETTAKRNAEDDATEAKREAEDKAGPPSAETIAARKAEDAATEKKRAALDKAQARVDAEIDAKTERERKKEDIAAAKKARDLRDKRAMEDDDKADNRAREDRVTAHRRKLEDEKKVA